MSTVPPDRISSWYTLHPEHPPIQQPERTVSPLSTKAQSSNKACICSGSGTGNKLLVLNMTTYPGLVELFPCVVASRLSHPFQSLGALRDTDQRLPPTRSHIQSSLYGKTGWPLVDPASGKARFRFSLRTQQVFVLTPALCPPIQPPQEVQSGTPRLPHQTLCT